MEVSNVVKTIRSQLYASGEIIIGSWGAHDWMAMDENTLQFKVQGHHFKGHVRIAYDEDYDLYDIHFGHWKHHQWHNLSTIESVYCDEMIYLIDDKVEYIDQYKNG